MFTYDLTFYYEMKEVMFIWSQLMPKLAIAWYLFTFPKPECTQQQHTWNTMNH